MAQSNPSARASLQMAPIVGIRCRVLAGRLGQPHTSGLVPEAARPLEPLMSVPDPEAVHPLKERCE
ncbi:hypothetical protein BX589_1323 [Paraburkholderia fungorum]|jgi:hypothetical protein|nr:hypothetical protein BX589_1323 [Paraburkholderia fungorum]